MRLHFLCFTLIFISACSSAAPAPTLMPGLAATVTPTRVETTLPAPSALPEASPSPSETSTQPSFSPGSDLATFLGETYPDGAVLKPGETFIKTWDVKNLGSTTWTKDYHLTLMTSGETLSSPAQIPFPASVAPAETAHLSVTLKAPQTPGKYTVVWALQNPQGQIFKVDGSDVWVSIQVCDSPTGCAASLPAGQSASAGSVSAVLQAFSPSAQSASASFCLTLPENSRNWGPEGIFLILDGRSVPFSTGGSLQPTGCFEFDFPVSQADIDSAGSIALSIGNVRLMGGPPNPQQRCEDVKPTLVAQRPGLDFTCSFSMAGYYTNLKLPAGMSAAEADQLITDAIEGAIYGPWVLTIR